MGCVVSDQTYEEFHAGCGPECECYAAKHPMTAPTVERVEALCRLLVDEGHMTAEGQRQVVALWGGGER